jgi:hypothetical protein
LSSGCLGGASPATKFYTLVPAASPRAGAPPAGPDRGVTLGVGPVTVPAYLDRPQIVTRQGSDELDLAEHDRWAEPLPDSIARVMAENLSAMLGTDRVAIFPWSVSQSVPYQVTVDLLRFDGALGGDIVLDARWRIVAGDGKELLVKRSTLREATTAPGYGALVSSMSRALGGLSRDIATVLAGLPR